MSSCCVTLSISMYTRGWGCVWGPCRVSVKFCGAALAQEVEGQNQLLQIVLWPPRASTHKIDK